MTNEAPDDRRLLAASFLAQALDLDPNLDPAVLAADLVELRHDAHASIYAAELDSSVGPTAFLIYVYALAATGPDGQTGGDLFATDLATLERAAEHDAPGPRLVAHAQSEREGYILATTPATLRALRGEAPDDALASLVAGPDDLLPGGDSAETRRASATELLRLLRLAEGAAATWMGALRAEGRLQTGDALDETIVFNDVETELALFLLDERSIRSLLGALNLLLTAARAGAAQATGRPASEE